MIRWLRQLLCRHYHVEMVIEFLLDEPPGNPFNEGILRGRTLNVRLRCKQCGRSVADQCAFNADNYLDGMLDEIEVYDHVLAADEIKSHYNARRQHDEQ